VTIDTPLIPAPIRRRLPVLLGAWIQRRPDVSFSVPCTRGLSAPPVPWTGRSEGVWGFRALQRRA